MMTGTLLSLTFQFDPYCTSTTLTSYRNADIANVRYGKSKRECGMCICTYGTLKYFLHGMKL